MEESVFIMAKNITPMKLYNAVSFHSIATPSVSKVYNPVE